MKWEKEVVQKQGQRDKERLGLGIKMSKKLILIFLSLILIGTTIAEPLITKEGSIGKDVQKEVITGNVRTVQEAKHIEKPNLLVGILLIISINILGIGGFLLIKNDKK